MFFNRSLGVSLIVTLLGVDAKVPAPNRQPALCYTLILFLTPSRIPQYEYDKTA